MSRGCREWGGLVYLGLGLVGGLVLTSVWPNTPLHAVATDRLDTFAIATGPVDDQSEAIYFLDFLTGDLNAAVIGRQPGGGKYMVTGHYGRNVLSDIGVDAAKNPRFLMTTGLADLMRGGKGGAVQPSRAVVYVAEVTSGRVAAYAVPWNATLHTRGQFVRQPLVQIIAFPFRAAAPMGKAKDNE